MYCQKSLTNAHQSHAMFATTTNSIHRTTCRRRTHRQDPTRLYTPHPTASFTATKTAPSTICTQDTMPNPRSAQEYKRHSNSCNNSSTGSSSRNHQHIKPLTLATISCILLTTTILIVQGYNLDTQKALIKHGPKGSYFGYSIAQHATFEPQNLNSTFKSYVIVGAPRADSSRSSLSAVVRPGAIFKCDFSLSQACQVLDIENLAQNNAITSGASDLSTNTQLGDEAPPTGQLLASAMDPVVQRDNQWLGVSVKSQGPNGYALACAHRYVLKGYNYRWGQGICYSMTKNLTLHKAWQPCLNRPVNMAHEEYGYCQVGTSSDISESSDIVVGSPGPYTWRGTVFTNSIGFSARDDRTWYMAPVQDDEAKVDKYSYLGMSVISGKFFNKQQYYVSGAPRSKEMGQVLFMTKQAAASGRRGDSSNFRTDQILNGEQIASSFGYTLAKMDFNGDGQLDLVVSAPFYYTKTEGGAVYLYANDGKAVQPAGKLTGKPESRFGFALANCGDLNRDKFEDLAIGAPYDDQGGVVYIHSGSATGIKATPSQIIKASEVSSNLQTFGYSLSGGLDMDQNGYPDLVVGSYADDSVFILRARPIIQISTKIEGNLNKIDANRTSCDGERGQYPCFKFNTCFELDPAAIGEYSASMKLKYRIVAETFTGQKMSRVKFHDSETSESPHIVEKEILMEDYYPGMKLKRCNEQRVFIVDRSDIQTPIQFKLTYSLVPPNQGSDTTTHSSSHRYYSMSSYSSSNLLSTSLSGDQSSTLPATFPILNQDEAQRIFSARFLKDCGSNDICESHLEVEGQLQMPRETLGINEPGFATDKQVNVTIKVANNNEPAYEAKLFVTHPPALIYSGFKATKQVTVVDCISVEKNLVKCDLGNPMTRGSSRLLMIFNTQNQPGTFEFNLMVNTTSPNAREARASVDLSGSIRKKIEIPIAVRPPPVYPETPTQDPPAWLILASVLLGIILFCALFYCLYVNGFFERSKAQYRAAQTEDRFT